MADIERLQIVRYPAKVLREPAQEVAHIDDNVRHVAERMIELMHEARGVGLAAPQVGLPWRLFVVNATGEAGDDQVFINPVLRDPSPETGVREEGCLSIPHVNAEITRPTAITIEATNLEGETVTLRSDELPARVWQHEFDHLEGVLILDRMTRIDRMANKRAIQELEQA